MRHQSHDIRKVVRLLTSWGRCRHQLSREYMAELCHYVASRLRDMGVIHWLEGGNLLGAVRESGRLLAWEDDVDLSWRLGLRSAVHEVAITSIASRKRGSSPSHTIGRGFGPSPVNAIACAAKSV